MRSLFDQMVQEPLEALRIQLISEPMWPYTRGLLSYVLAPLLLIAIAMRIGKAIRRRRTTGKPVADRPVFVSGEIWDWSKWGCPGCGGKEIYEGPQGGGCQNICCANPACQRAFNMAFGIGIVWDIKNTWFLPAFEPKKEQLHRWMDSEEPIRDPVPSVVVVEPKQSSRTQFRPNGHNLMCRCRDCTAHETP